ncbi:hypothetical protein P7C70_g6136, partial [Phenoliferia sp. Uapishka_3]
MLPFAQDEKEESDGEEIRERSHSYLLTADEVDWIAQMAEQYDALHFNYRIQSLSADYPTTVAYSEMGPPPPKVRRSYASTASSGPPSASTSSPMTKSTSIHKPSPSTFAPVASASFFQQPPTTTTTTSSSPALSTGKVAHSMQPRTKTQAKPKPKEKQPVKSVERATYMEIDEDETDELDELEEDELEISTVKPKAALPVSAWHKPPNLTGSKPSSSKAHVEGDELRHRRPSSSSSSSKFRPGKDDDTFEDTSPDYSPHFIKPSSHPPTYRPKASPPLPTSGWDTDVSFDSPLPELIADEPAWGADEPIGPGMVVSKIVAMEGEDGGLGGVWAKSVWDVSIEWPVEEVGEEKYKKLGSWIPKEEPTTEVEMRQLVENPLIPIPPPTIQSDVEMQGPSRSSSPIISRNNLPKLPAGFHTISQTELANARPHPDAYFCPSTFSWVLFTRLLKDETAFPLLPLESGKFDNWRYTPLEFTPSSLPSNPPLGPIFPPFDTSSLTIKAQLEFEGGLSKGGLKKMVSKKGESVAISGLEWFPAVVPGKVWKEFLEDERDLVVGRTKIDGKISAALLVWRAIDNLIFRGQPRALPVTGKTFSKSVVWNEHATNIFVGTLGFTAKGGLIHPPKIDERIPEQVVDRARLVRAWLEIGIWLEFTKLTAGKPTILKPPSPIKIKSAREAVLECLGGDDLPRISKASTWITTGANSKSGSLDPAASEYDSLGVTPALADEVVISMYHDQCEYVPSNAPHYLGCLQAISKIRSTDALQLVLATEQSKGRYTTEDLLEAYKAINCTGPDPSSLPEDIVASAFSSAFSDVSTADEKKKHALKQACLLIAKSRESEFLKIITDTGLMEEEKVKMDLGRAYRLLELPEGTTEPEFILALYGVRIMDAPGQAETMKEALGVIGDHLQSPEIKKFLETGSTDVGDVWEASPATSLDRPVGLTNIANTCYLNSLLQYFFTVRELRETILTYSGNFKAVTGNDELPRVGGRLVTKAEVERSRRCKPIFTPSQLLRKADDDDPRKVAILLQGLFNQLIHSPTSAVTPETELAYLALVPSKEEAAATATKEIEDAAAESDSIAMDVSPSDAPPASPSSEEAKSPSVLGKRTSEHLDSGESGEDDIEIDKMMIDSQLATSPIPDRDLDVELRDVSPQPAPESSMPRRSPSSLGKNFGTLEPQSFDENLATSLSAKEAADGVVEIGAPDVEMTLLAPPPLPPRDRKGKEKSKESTGFEKEVSAYMSFGKQNDVTECMDNVMFQLECALNPTSSDSDGGEAASLVKRTFYGKMKQELEIDDPTETDRIRVKEDPFFSLLVDVAEPGHNLYDGLDTVFDDAVVEIEGKKARRRITLIDVPPILQIQLQRVQYDRVAQKAFKSNAHMSFGEALSVDRYLEIDPSDAEAVERRDRTAACRQEIEKARSRLQDLTKLKHTDMGKTLADAHNHVIGTGLLDDELTAALGDSTLVESAALDEEISQLRARVDELRGEIEAIWIDQQSATFELVSVFIHRGSASSGHYYIYQRDSKKPERWLKYNDSFVTDIDPKEEVFREKTGDSNAYFLVYCRKDRLDAIESIKRE